MPPVTILMRMDNSCAVNECVYGMATGCPTPFEQGSMSQVHSRGFCDVYGVSSGRILFETLSNSLNFFLELHLRRHEFPKP